MKLILTRNLKGGEVLAKNLIDPYGNVLLMAGTSLSIEYILKIRDAGIFFLFIESEEDTEPVMDSQMLKLKNTMLEVMPDLFKRLLDGEKNGVREELSLVDDLINYIIEKGNVSTNLYELQNFDDYTYVHCVDTSIMAAFIGVETGMNIEKLKSLTTGALLHDIGKTKLPEGLINSKKPLTQKEYDEIKKHPIYGYKVLREAGFEDENMLACVLEHHERVDGFGYPFKKTGDSISTFGKIVAICDVYTALSANRSYRLRFNPNEAYEYIVAGSNNMFDKKIVQQFKENFAIYPYGSRILLSNDCEGVIVGQNKGFPDRPVVRVTRDIEKKPIIKKYDIDLLYNNSVIIKKPIN